MSCQMMMSLGVYVLGAADAGERARVEAHLPGCAAWVMLYPFQLSGRWFSTW